jgi:hypothetical protein
MVTALGVGLFLILLWGAGFCYAMKKGDDLYREGGLCGLLYMMSSALILAAIGLLLPGS